MKSNYVSRFNWPKAAYFDAAQPLRFILAASLLAGLAAGLGWLTTRHGANLSPDSVYYLNVAENVCQGRALVYTTGLAPDQVGAAVPLTLWPPAYPLLLCGLSWLTGSVVTAARWVSLLAYVGLAVGCLALGRDCANIKVGVLAALGVIVSAALLRVISFAWSEPLFLFCSVTGWWGMWRAWNKPQERSRYLAVAAVTWSLAGLTRYLGVVLLVWGAFMIAAMPLPRPARWRYLCFYSLLAPLPLAGWLWRNYLLTGYLSGDARLGTTASFLQNIVLAGRLLLRDFFFPLPPAATLIPYALFLALLFLVRQLLPALDWRLTAARRRPWARGGSRSWFSLPWWAWMFLYCLVYVSILIVLSATVQFEPLESRLLSPVYPFLWLLFAAGVVHFYNQLPALQPAWRRVGAGVVWSFLLLLWLTNQLRAQYYNVAHPPAWAYNSPTWSQDPAILSLSLSASDPGPIYTNMPAAVSFVTQRPAYRLPEEANAAQQAAFFQGEVRARSGFVIWYVDGWEQKASITADTLARWCARLSGDCQLLAAHKHAVIYQFN